MTFNFPKPDRPPVAITIDFLEDMNTIQVSNAKDHPNTPLIMHGLAEKSWTVNVPPRDDSWFSVYDPRAITSRESMLLLKAAIEEAYGISPTSPIVGDYGKTGDSLGCRDSVTRVVNLDGSVTTTTRTPLDRYPWFTETILITGVEQ